MKVYLPNKIIYLGCSLALLLSVNAQAKYEDVNKDNTSLAFNTCIQKSDGATFKMIDCTNKEIALQEKALDTQYKQALSKLPKDRQRVLTRSQEGWRSYYKSACEIYNDPALGQSALTNTSGCYLGVLLERVDTMSWLSEHAVSD